MLLQVITTRLRTEKRLVAILAFDIVARVAWFPLVGDLLVFDEVFYVNAARVILGRDQAPVVFLHAVDGFDPNIEHPPLGKLIIAACIGLIGDNSLGWRIASMTAGALTLLVFNLLARELLDFNKRTADFATFALAFENLFFVHTRLPCLMALYFRRFC